jgi:hypothetical protein
MCKKQKCKNEGSELIRIKSVYGVEVGVASQ